MVMDDTSLKKLNCWFLFLFSKIMMDHIWVLWLGILIVSTSNKLNLIFFRNYMWYCFIGDGLIVIGVKKTNTNCYTID